jgi:hypothetical protein
LLRLLRVLEKDEEGWCAGECMRPGLRECKRDRAGAWRESSLVQEVDRLKGMGPGTKPGVRTVDCWALDSAIRMSSRVV